MLPAMWLLVSFHLSLHKANADSIYDETFEKTKSIVRDDYIVSLLLQLFMWSGYVVHDTKYDAARFLGEVLEKQQRVLGEDRGDTFDTLFELAETYRSQGRQLHAARLLEALLEKQQSVLGEDHLNTLFTMSRLAYPYGMQGKECGSTGISLEEVLEKQQRLL